MSEHFAGAELEHVGISFDARASAELRNTLGYNSQILFLDDLIHPEDYKKHRLAEIQSFATIHSSEMCDIRLRAVDGSWRWFRQKVSTVLCTDGQKRTGRVLIEIGDLRPTSSFDTLQRRFVETDQMRVLGSLVISELEPDKVVAAILTQALEFIPFEKALVWKIQDGKFWWMGGKGLSNAPPASIAEVNPRIHAFLEGRVPVLLTENFSIHQAQIAEVREMKWLGCPLVHKGNPIGFMEFVVSDQSLLNEEHLWPAMIFSEHVAIALHNSLDFIHRVEEADIDTLTGLRSRRGIQRWLADHTTEYMSLVPRAFIMIDIDNFKQVNDTWGHSAGDMILRSVGKILIQECRLPTITGRWGGDEIAVFFPMGSRKEVESLCAAIRTQFKKDSENQKLPEPSTLSFGVALTTDPQLKIEALIEKADEALYRVKRSGRDACVVLECGNELG